MIRTCIFCYYDADGKMSSDIIYLMKSLKQVVDYFIFVANGYVITDEVENITDYIYIRENKGLDAGAYKAAMKKYHSIIEVSNELILCNSTFFGPFIPLSNIIDNMHLLNCDLYGLVPWKIGIEDYIQSYFLILKDTIFKSEIFKNYINTYIDENTDSYEEVCFYFERELQYLLKKCGFRSESYVKKQLPSPYLYPYECLKQGAFIMKKKCFDKKLDYCDRNEILNCLSYIYVNYDYDINLIIDWINDKWKWQLTLKEVSEHIIRNEKKLPDIEACSREDILSFYLKNNAVYIYGTGVIARLLYNSLKFGEEYKKIKGFIVSEKNVVQEMYGLPVIEYDEKLFNESVGIIVAVNARNARQIQKKIKHENCLYIYKYKV